MDTIFQQVIDLITNNPGNLIYHLVLAFSIMGALQAAMHLWQNDEFPQGRRMVIGLGLLLGTRLILIIIAAWGYMSSTDWHILLPVVDRAMMAFALILIISLWTFPEPLRTADTTSALVGLLILILFIINQVWWSVHQSESAFNERIPSIAWEIFGAFILLIGSVLLIIRRPNRSMFGLAMIGVLVLGHIGQMLFPDLTSDYPGFVRLFEMAAYPLLWALPNRFTIPSKKTDQVVVASKQGEVRQRYGTNPDTFHDILSLTTKGPPEQTCKKITKLLAETLLADVSLLVLPPNDDGQITIQCGYDLIRETYLQPVLLASEQVPLLVSAMKHMRPLRLPASSTSKDLVSLGNNLEIDRTGHLLAAFVPPSNGENPLMGFILISPYSDRSWSGEDQDFLNKIATTLSLHFRQSDQLDNKRKELEIIHQSLESSQNLLEETQAENEILRNEFNAISERAIQELGKETVTSMNPEIESDDIIQQLKNENKRLEKVIEEFNNQESAVSTNTIHLEEELKLTLTEISQLNTQLVEAEEQLFQLDGGTNLYKELTENQVEVITSVSQELRQPMTSIVGYTELLLGESVGILGALQRKFLERIKASIERMDSLLDDLFQVISLDSEDLMLKPEPVDLKSVIEKNVEDTRAALKKRGISLQVDIPEKMPQLIVDRDALEQILIQLLNNASTATPENGKIFLGARDYQVDGTQDYVLIDVEDQGGGIPKKDLPRVFSRLYRADNPLIQGIGDTGVGLSIAKALVEAHNGRIWVDTEPGKGTTFSVLIPLSSEFETNLLLTSNEEVNPQ